MHLFSGFEPLGEPDVAIAPVMPQAKSKQHTVSLRKFATPKMNDKFIIKSHKNNT
jgi:hypothetical protein